MPPILALALQAVNGVMAEIVCAGIYYNFKILSRVRKCIYPRASGVNFSPSPRDRADLWPTSWEWLSSAYALCDALRV